MTLRGIINRLLRRPPHFGMGEDYWRRGDLAICTGDGPWFSWPSGREVSGPKHGELYRVSDVTMRYGNEYLRLNGQWWGAVWFKKVRPDNREACTEGFKLRMKGLRPKVDA